MKTHSQKCFSKQRFKTYSQNTTLFFKTLLCCNMCIYLHACASGRDMIDRALVGNTRDLDEYIADFDLEGVSVPVLTAAEWDKKLPSWKTRDDKRGLKQWGSAAGKGGWVVPGVCGKAINSALDYYMQIYAVPPVVEGEKINGDLLPKKGGVDLRKGFLLTVRSKHFLKTLLQNTPSKHFIKT